MEQTQERLLNAAAELFSKQGYAGVSMRDIARAVGITQAAIYHHFPNKDALYIATVTHLFEQHTLGISKKCRQSMTLPSGWRCLSVPCWRPQKGPAVQAYLYARTTGGR